MPPPPPPPPPLNKKPPTSVGGGGADAGRGLLLESIRQGKQLKKTVGANDRSSSLATTASVPRGRSGLGNASESKAPSRTAQAMGPVGLGDLFAGGMPKLKSVNSKNVPSSTGPPQPPPPSQKPNASKVLEDPEPVERKLSFGKPSVAPKPPALNNKQARPNPPPKLPNLYIPPPPSAEDSESQPPTPPFGVNRTQSMRLTASAAEIPAPDYRTIGRKHTNIQPPPPPRSMNGGNRQRPTPLRPPSARPPPPPNKAPPQHQPPSPPHTQAPPPPPVSYAPPPPPPLSHAPPPPPHRSQTPLTNRNNNNPGPETLGASLNQNGAPPPPPTRNSSMRNANVIQSRGGVDLEERFRHLFLPIENLPQPEHFTGVIKTYPSKIAQSVKRQPAPQPPSHNQIQLGDKWLSNTSTC